MSYRKYLITSDEPPSELYKSVEVGTNLAEVGADCISRQAAIEALERAKQNIRHNIERAIGRAICEILDEVENGIKQLPSTNCSEFPNNSDTISREAVADAINGIECTRHTTWYEFYQKVMTAVEKLPPAHPEIIRCRECKFASGDSRICMKFDHSPIGELDFCSFAERREVAT